MEPYKGRIHKEYPQLTSEDEEEIEKITRDYKTKKEKELKTNEDIWQLGELSNGEIGFYPVALSQLVNPRQKLKHGQLAPLHDYSHTGAFFEQKVKDMSQDPPVKIECKNLDILCGPFDKTYFQ